ncbi:TetR/AcrR family transcriptional regulator [Nocardia sp. NBC_00565]|uniref:TetR/AcrR family transcriptional regulator n=1 Tax=Nocardia sp. NBC_00565 TaxID=2975993 RepID=UPI002E80B2FE|nr:TetR/AcrR family transcriptional regulator [Nocardia sp. NBC_00565]WUC05669.1 TetR/AcrR family transcriptional regulator [Nocardia sp. NBC_00565]
MSENRSLRRASYGPSSPEIGSRGTNTRRKIVDVSLRLFGELGFFNTSVDAIAKEAGVSRATLYQYFPGKDEIFLELMDECGSALLRVTRRIGALGPTPTGFDNLNWWLGEWSWVFERYSTMFVQWANVAATESVVQPEIDRFVGRYQHQLAGRLANTDLGGLDPESAAMAMMAVVHRVNLYLHTDRAHGRSIESVVDALSVFLQLMFFPDTPPSVFDTLPLRVDSAQVISIPHPPAASGLSIEERTSGISKRARQTVERLVAAGATQFAARGYYRANVDDIVAAAGYARGTFYKYFNEKQDLLLTVCAEAAARALVLDDELRQLAPPSTDRATLRAWLSSFVQFETQFGGSIDVWTERTAERSLVADLGVYGEAMTDSAILDYLSTVDRPGFPFDPIGAVLVFRAILERLARASQEIETPLTHDQVVDLMATIIERGFFSHSRDRTATLAPED